MGFDLNGINPKINKPDTDENPGVYFRNNVWWWRPLWDFVCMQCDDFMTESQKMGGSYNDGKLIDQVIHLQEIM